MARAKKNTTSIRNEHGGDAKISGNTLKSMTGVQGSPPEEPEQEPDASTDDYASASFTVRFVDHKAHVSPVNWVGPAPLIFHESRLGELADLLGRANQR